MSKEAASVGIRIKAGSIMRRHAQSGLKSSDVTCIPLRHGHPPRDARMEFQRSSERWLAARGRGRKDGTSEGGGEPPWGSRHAMARVGWRRRASHNSLPCSRIGRFGLTLRGHNSGPFYCQDLKF